MRIVAPEVDESERFPPMYFGSNLAAIPLKCLLFS